MKATAAVTPQGGFVGNDFRPGRNSCGRHFEHEYIPSMSIHAQFSVKYDTEVCTNFILWTGLSAATALGWFSLIRAVPHGPTLSVDNVVVALTLFCPAANDGPRVVGAYTLPTLSADISQKYDTACRPTYYTFGWCRLSALLVGWECWPTLSIAKMMTDMSADNDGQCGATLTAGLVYLCTKPDEFYLTVVPVQPLRRHPCLDIGSRRFAAICWSGARQLAWVCTPYSLAWSWMQTAYLFKLFRSTLSNFSITHFVICVHCSPEIVSKAKPV